MANTHWLAALVSECSLMPPRDRRYISDTAMFAARSGQFLQGELWNHHHPTAELSFNWYTHLLPAVVPVQDAVQRAAHHRPSAQLPNSCQWRWLSQTWMATVMGTHKPVGMSAESVLCQCWDDAPEPRLQVIGVVSNCVFPATWSNPPTVSHEFGTKVHLSYGVHPFC